MVSIKLAGSLAFVFMFLTQPVYSQEFSIKIEEGSVSGPGELASSRVLFDVNTPENCTGFSYSLCDVPGSLSVVSEASGSTLQTVHNGNPPDFEAIRLFPGEGLTHAAVFDFFLERLLFQGSNYELQTFELLYSDNSLFCFCDGVPSVVTETLAVTRGDGVDVIPPIQTCGQIGIQEFIRGDYNDSGGVNIADSQAILSYLSGGAEPSCFDSADANSDNSVDIADATWILNWLFSGGPAPASPFPSCGADPSPDSLRCDSFQPCS